MWRQHVVPLSYHLPFTEMPFLVEKGCYVDDSGNNAYMFGESNKVILVIDPEGKAYEQAIVE